MQSTDPKTGRPVKSSSGRFCGWNTIYGRDGEHGTPYMTRVWFWRLRLHIFHRGDQDEDTHDHPWAFMTFPLTPYVEEVVLWNREDDPDMTQMETVWQVVPAWRFTHRPATHTHRVLGSWSGAIGMFSGPFRRGTRPIPDQPTRKIITIVWRGPDERKWGFLKRRDGRWCWVHWREYVFGGGKDGPCL